jgi:hypothetical protein
VRWHNESCGGPFWSPHGLAERCGVQPLQLYAPAWSWWMSCQRNTVGNVVEGNGSRRQFCLFDRAGGLRENVNDRVVHLSGLASVVTVLEM